MKSYDRKSFCPMCMNFKLKSFKVGPQNTFLWAKEGGYFFIFLFFVFKREKKAALKLFYSIRDMKLFETLINTVLEKDKRIKFVNFCYLSAYESNVFFNFPVKRVCSFAPWLRLFRNCCVSVNFVYIYLFYLENCSIYLFI